MNRVILYDPDIYEPPLPRRRPRRNGPKPAPMRPCSCPCECWELTSAPICGFCLGGVHFDHEDVAS